MISKWEWRRQPLLCVSDFLPRLAKDDIETEVGCSIAVQEGANSSSMDGHNMVRVWDDETARGQHSTGMCRADDGDRADGLI